MADGGTTDGRGIGARVLRKEDSRHLAGRGNFTGDIKRPGQVELAFVRSPVAHALIKSVTKPAGFEKSVFTVADMPGMLPMRAPSKLPGYKGADYPALADGKVRFVGEPVAVCVAATRAEAEDIAQAVEVDYEELPPVVDMLAAREPDAPVIHDGWDDNIVLETFTEDDFSKIADRATVVVKREYRMARQAMNPMEGKAVFVEWDDRVDQLMMWTSTQVPHLIRTGLAQFLGLEQRQVRVIAPDVGGSFGIKANVYPEYLIALYAARLTGRPVKWMSDRTEGFLSDFHGRDNVAEAALALDEDGKFLGFRLRNLVNIGAYFSPIGSGPATNNLGGLSGVYTTPAAHVEVIGVMSNSHPTAPYRGAGRPEASFIIERLIDIAAHELEIGRAHV